MRDDFFEFLQSEGVLSPDRAEWVRHARRQPTEPIGSIAFSYGLLTGEEVDEILDQQKQSRRPFGEIAVEMGVLDDGQIARLLEIQLWRATMETAEAIILAGTCPTAVIMNCLGRFLSSRYERSALDPRPSLRAGAAN